MTLGWIEPPEEHPVTGAFICTRCGSEHVTRVGAEACEHRADRLDHERPVGWWTTTDEAILRGALAELAELPRPAYVERDRDRLVYRPLVPGLPRRTRVAREVGAWIMLVGVIVGFLLLLVAGSEHPDPVGPGPIVTPATYEPVPAR